MITYDIPVYIGKENGDSGVSIKCHDSGVQLAVKLLQSGWLSKWRETAKPYTIPEGATAKFRVRRHDRARTSTEAYIQPDGRVLCPVHPYSVATPGYCNAEVAIFDKDGRRLTSATFVFKVEEECAPVNGEEDPVYVDSIQGLMKTAEDAAKRAEDAAEEAKQAGSQVDPEMVKESVNDYLAENPVQAGATAEEAAQIEQNKKDIETLNREKLPADALPGAINEALAQAKASGDFKGEPGQPGDDYVLTEDDKQEIAEMAAELVEVPESGGNVDLTGVVRSVNGQTPDENGNVEIEVGSGSSQNVNGLTATEKTLILSLFKNAAYTADMSATIAQLETLWSGGTVEPDEPVIPDVPEADVSQTGSILSIVSGVTVSQSGSVLAIA
jgi:hypothetical protein